MFERGGREMQGEPNKTKKHVAKIVRGTLWMAVKVVVQYKTANRGRQTSGGYDFSLASSSHLHQALVDHRTRDDTWMYECGTTW
jgi:hypothetical protein